MKNLNYSSVSNVTVFAVSFTGAISLKLVCMWGTRICFFKKKTDLKQENISILKVNHGF